MKIQLATKPLSEIKSDFVVFPVFEPEESTSNLNSILPIGKLEIIKQFLSDNPKFGKLFESQLLYTKDQKIILLGLGKKSKLDFKSLQHWAGAATKSSLTKAKQISLFLPQDITLSVEEIGQAVAIGAEIALFDPSKTYKSEAEPTKLVSVEIIVERAERGYQDGLKRGQIIAEGINLVRRLGDMPANDMTPTYFLNIVKEIAKENKLKLTVLDEKQAKKKGMGAFCGVAQGSDEPSYMIALEHSGNIRTKDKMGLIGKGITFDTGGLNLKPGNHMNEMQYDMLGAAAVLATMQIAAKLGFKSNLVGVMPVTENMPGAHAQKPGDIVKTYSGKTAEVLNTDAEGRLVLIDAVAFAQQDFKATKLIDLATLTGAIIVALGDFYTGAFGNNPKFTQDIIASGAKVGEKIWELPMDEEFDEMVKGDFGDITNIGHGGSMPGAAGSITGAKFIEAGVKDNAPWVHLDIAGTAWDMKPKPYRGKGATGVSVKTLVELLSNT